MSTASPSPHPRRRTQHERRTATVAKLVDATIAAIAELGYQRATVQEICGRAGLSTGAMFRQFPTRLDLIVRTAQDIFIRQQEGFAAVVGGFDTVANPIDAALRFLRSAQSSNMVHALREIYLAARSDGELRTHLTPIAAAHYRELAAAAEGSGVLNAFRPELREPLFYLVLHMFSGEAVVRGVLPRPDLDESVLALLEDMLTTYAGIDRD